MSSVGKIKLLELAHWSIASSTKCLCVGVCMWSSWRFPPATQCVCVMCVYVCMCEGSGMCVCVCVCVCVCMCVVILSPFLFPFPLYYGSSRNLQRVFHCPCRIILQVPVYLQLYILPQFTLDAETGLWQDINSGDELSTIFWNWLHVTCQNPRQCVPIFAILAK